MAEFNAGTLYDYNKDLVSQVDKPMTRKELYNKLKEVALPYAKTKLLFSSYFLLLCHEDRNYTFFEITPNSLEESTASLINELQECLINRGDVYSVMVSEDNIALEIWIKQDGEMLCYYFFPCDKCVVKVGGQNGKTDNMYS